MMDDYKEASMRLHEKFRGKIGVHSKVPLHNLDDLSAAYTPGVAEPSRALAADPSLARKLTIKGNTVAVVTDGSAVLGLGNIGPLAALPVMEGKCLLFKEFADIDAFPICLDTQDPAEIVETVKRIVPVFGGINLEDIAAPKAFEVEEALLDIGVPVFHDDQHGTAIVLLAALINACRVTGKKLEELHIVINGAGAAGVAIARLLRCVSVEPDICIPVREVIVCDRKGAIHRERDDLNNAKNELLHFTNSASRKGTVQEMLVGADVFIGVSQGDLISAGDIRRMNPDPIVFAMANPVPEIMPEQARSGGAIIVGTGRSDFPNQVNNLLAFPGVFRGALDAEAKRITSRMKMAAVYALADCVTDLGPERILPESLDKRIANRVADRVAEAARAETEFMTSVAAE